jgi:hypothetical protein
MDPSFEICSISSKATLLCKSSHLASFTRFGRPSHFQAPLSARVAPPCRAPLPSSTLPLTKLPLRCFEPKRLTQFLSLGSDAPASSKPCNLQPCQAITWLASPWGDCPASVNCNSVQARVVECVDQSGLARNESFCADVSPKPAEAQTCRNLASNCDYCKVGFFEFDTKCSMCFLCVSRAVPSAYGALLISMPGRMLEVSSFFGNLVRDLTDEKILRHSALSSLAILSFEPERPHIFSKQPSFAFLCEHSDNSG